MHSCHSSYIIRSTTRRAKKVAPPQGISLIFLQRQNSYHIKLYRPRPTGTLIHNPANSFNVTENYLRVRQKVHSSLCCVDECVSQFPRHTVGLSLHNFIAVT